MLMMNIYLFLFVERIESISMSICR